MKEYTLETLKIEKLAVKNKMKKDKARKRFYAYPSHNNLVKWLEVKNSFCLD